MRTVCTWYLDTFQEARRLAFTSEAEDRCETVERHTCTVLDPGPGEWVADPEVWPGLHSLARVRTERNGPHGRRRRAVRFYMASLPVDAKALLALVCGYWGIKNGLHRTLDVQFREEMTAACAGATPPPSWASSDGPS